ncbi:TIGR02642 family protein [Photobacterium nomapromontoriensis]|uniref:TIGR02642 family protein n=1 Tax=Photobacterium nomapromontoriensis TaxID=2910237 RepID=UPI003D10F500
MSRAIELLARMHEVRSVTADERGRQTLTGDVILAVFGRVQHKMPLGMDLLMAKYVHDAHAAGRIVDNVTQWVSDEPIKRKDLAIALGCVAFDVFCDKPVASQHRQLTALWRKYSDQAKRSNKLVKRWQCQVKNLQRELDLCDTKSAHVRTVNQINEIEALIIKEHRRLDEYAQCQGRTYSVCPRCAGTGIYAVAQCPSCIGHGVLAPTVDNVRQHLRHIGLGRVSEKLWSIELKPWFEKCLGRMYVESGDAARMLSEELHNEKD